eukprot:TRINITY_DN19529_c0_g1_i1.p1 TRINITY_DN19529_c0_g1~~TRINITY_DN19529_c0_g1_i1.p1  ORF type:complete len:598 (+),score=186.56 TRINITY_DN19529_c0_g1_i1:128-1921(+)
MSCAVMVVRLWLALAALALASADGHLDFLPGYFGINTRLSVAGMRDKLRAVGVEQAANAEALPSLGVEFVERSNDISRVRVSWQHVALTPAQRQAAFVGLWCAGSADHEMIDFIPVAADDTASTSRVVPFFQIRCKQQLRLLAPSSVGGFGVLAQSAAIDLDPTESLVYHMRLAYGDDPARSMWVSWTTTLEHADKPPTVFVSTSADGPYDQKFVGTSHTYHAKDMCNAPANITSPLHYSFPGWMHDVLVTGLNPSTRYYIRYGHDTELGYGESSFVTASAPSADATVRFVQFGDMALSLGAGAMATVEHILQLSKEIDFVLHSGDLGYAMGSGFQWDAWMAYIQPASSILPYMVALGNHESNWRNDVACPQNPSGEPNQFNPTWGDYNDDSGGEGGVPTFARFKAPAGSPGSRNIVWYSFDVGSVHVIHWSSEHDFTPGSVQHQWLLADLAAVNRSRTPWVVAAMHRPMRNACNDSDMFVGDGMTEALEPAFLDLNGGVDLVLAGHYHLYQRTCLLRNNTCVKNNVGAGRGVAHITVGTAGATVHNESIAVPEWVASYRPLLWGYGLVTAHNASALQWQFIANSDSALEDELWLFK